MYAVGRLGSYISRGVYTVSGPFHPFGGAVDIVVVEQPDGSFKSSPWYVRFGKFQGVLKTKEKVVTISVNGVEADFHMYLDHKGEAYFLREVDVEDGESLLYPLSSGDETDEPFVRDRRPMKSKVCNCEADKRKSAAQLDPGNGKIMSRTTTSGSSRIFGLVFGWRSMKEDSYQEGGDRPGFVRVNSLERAEIAADLLEMKWSTNLVSHNYRKEKSSRFSASDALNNMDDRDMRVEDEQEKCVSSVCDSDESSIRNWSLQNETDSCPNQQGINSSGSGMKEQDCAEDAVVRMSSVSSTEQVVEASQETILEEKHSVLSNASGNSDHDGTPKGDILGMTCDRRIQYEVRDAFCSGSGTPNEDSVSNQVPSFVYHEASENSIMRLDGSSEQSCDALCISGGVDGGASIHVETLLTRADLSSEGAVFKQAEEMELDIEEAITRPEVFYEMTRDDHQLGSMQELETHSLSTTSSVADSDSQVKTDKNMDIAYPAAGQVGDCGTNTISSSSSESSEEEQFLFSDLDEFKLSRSDHVYNDHHASNDRTDRGVYQVSSMNGCSHSSMNQLAQDNQSVDVKISNGHSRMRPSPITTLSSHSGFSENAPQKVESLPDMWSPDAKLDAYNHHPLSHSLDSSSELMKMEFFCKDDFGLQEDRLADIRSCNRISRMTSSPISIRSSYIEKPEREVEPFPGIWSPHDKLDACDHPQSHSTDSNLGSLKGEIFSKDDSIIQGNQSADKPDIKRSTDYSRMKSTPISLVSSRVAHEKAGWQVDSSSNMWSPDAKLQTHGCLPLNHSLGSNSKSINIQSFCTVDSIVHNNQSADMKCSNEKPRMTSHPIGILSNPQVAIEETGWKVESLPNTWSRDTQLYACDHHPLGHSLDSTSESMKTKSFFKDNSIGQDGLSVDTTGSSSRKSRMTSIPSNIVSTCRVAIEKPEQQVESLPNVWSQSDAYEHHLLGHSSDSSSESMKAESFSKDSIVENHPSADTKSSIERLSMASSPISILSGRRVASEKTGRQVESLPNMWSSDAKLNAHDHHPLSHSLGSKSESMKVASFCKDELSCLKPNAEKKGQIAEEIPNTEESWTSLNLKDVHNHPAVELSLCKHLLYERMGADAAARAFEAEKLDLSKFKSIGPTVMKNDRLVVRIGGRYFPWPAAAPILLGMVTFGSEEIFEPKGMIPVDWHEGDQTKESGSWRLWPFSFKRSRSRITMPPDLSNARNDVENAVEDTVFSEGVEKTLVKPKQVKKMIRATTPTSEQLASLNLKEGSNTVTCTFSTAMLGNQKVDARIYLWKWNTRIVISDVDGTITKSDILGQFMPLVGIDWSQTGVAHLFSGIKENGYHLLFLSARAISQAYHTRRFLVNLKQDGKALPDGPIVISPDGLFPSLYREVIRRAPHEFKIACLEDIKALFPPDYNPFYAGFGNRDTDEISYLKVGIPKGKIFIINPKGEVAVNRHVNTKSYTSLHVLVNDMFPPMATSEQEDFNSWNYWKLPPPVIDI